MNTEAASTANHPTNPIRLQGEVGLVPSIANEHGKRAPEPHLVDISDVGRLATFLASTHRQRRVRRCRHQDDSPHSGSHRR